MATIYLLKMLHDSLSPPLPSLLKRFSIAIVSTRTKEGMISSGFVQRTRGIDIFFRVVAEGNTGYYRGGGYYERLLCSSLPFFRSRARFETSRQEEFPVKKGKRVLIVLERFVLADRGPILIGAGGNSRAKNELTKRSRAV